MRIVPPLPNMNALVQESLLQDFDFMRRLIDDYTSGANRFDQTGEALFGAFANRQLIGVCGLNRDPYLDDPQVGRVRHLYVLADWRRHRVGRRLVEAVIAEAQSHFALLTLWTNAADMFYRSVGFTPVTHIPKATHAMQLTNPKC